MRAPNDGEPRNGLTDDHPNGGARKGPPQCLPNSPPLHRGSPLVMTRCLFTCLWSGKHQLCRTVVRREGLRAVQVKVGRRAGCLPPVLLRVGVVIRGLPILCALMCPEVHVQVAVRVAVQPGVHLGRHCVGNQEPLRKWRRISLCPVITGA